MFWVQLLVKKLLRKLNMKEKGYLFTRDRVKWERSDWQKYFFELFFNLENCLKEKTSFYAIKVI